MEHIEYCNNLINIMASRTQKYEIKNVLTDCDLNINYHGMNGNLQECSVTLFCSQNDYVLRCLRALRRIRALR